MLLPHPKVSCNTIRYCCCLSSPILCPHLPLSSKTTRFHFFQVLFLSNHSSMLLSSTYGLDLSNSILSLSPTVVIVAFCDSLSFLCSINTSPSHPNHHHHYPQCKTAAIHLTLSLDNSIYKRETLRIKLHFFFETSLFF